MTHMKALVWHARDDLRLDDVPRPTATTGSVVVDVAFCGVCGTDTHEVSAGPVLIREAPHPLSGEQPPVVLGHEFSGRIAEIAPEDVERAKKLGLTVGQRVVADPCLRCNDCMWCSRGLYHQCPQGGSIGLVSNGGFAEAVRVPLENLHVIPDNVSDEWAALAEPMAVGMHAVSRAEVGPGQSVLIHGAGPIGLTAVIAAVAAGAGAVYVSEIVDEHADRALRLGATAVFNPLETDVRREVFTRTGRIGADAIIDATGRTDVVADAVRSVRRGGTVVMAGIGQSELTIDARQLLFYERTLRGSLGYNFDIPRVLALMSTGRIDPSPLVGGTRPLAEALDVFRTQRNGEGPGGKILISCAEGQ